MAANPQERRYSFEQYMTLLRNNEQRLEYDHGEIYAMAGSSANHAAISANMLGVQGKAWTVRKLNAISGSWAKNLVKCRSRRRLFSWGERSW